MGTFVRIAGELSRIWLSALSIRWLIVLASFAQIAGIGLFFYTMWSRIRPVGSRAREEQGERF
jgi:hypothetical protein